MQKLFELLNDERFAINNFEFPDIKSENVDFSLPENILANYNKLRENLIAYEAIDFQKYSKLGEALTKVFQRLIDYKNNLDISRLKESEKDEFVRKSILAYSKKNLSVELKEAIKSSINLKVKKIFIEDTPSMSFAVAIIPDAQLDEYSIDDRIYGRHHVSEDDDAIADFLTLANSIDPKTGKFTKGNVWGTREQYELDVYLCIDPLFLVAMDTYIPKDQFEELTAREMAAIYLHEIGHVTADSERIADLYYIERRINGIFENLKNTDNEKFIKLVYNHKSELKKYIDNYKSNHTDIDKTKKGLFFVLEGLVWWVESVEVHTDSKLKAYIVGIMKAYFIYLLKSLIIIQNVALFVIINVFSSIANAVELRYKNNWKTSDFMYTYNTYVASERSADEYVVRSGFGKDNASLDIKLVDTWRKYRNSPGRVSRVIRNDKLMWYTTEILSYLFYFVNMATRNYGLDCHGQDYDRMYKTAQMTIQVFKDNTSKEIRDMYIDQYEGILESLEALKKNKYAKLDRLNYKLMRFFDLSTLSTIMGSSNLPKDYEVIKEELDELMDNKFYYVSAKLAQLAD